jgi:GNAT superfamily N-acetyltransferase
VSIAFTVSSVFDVDVVEGGWRLTERPVAPYLNDYDALEPPTFAERWDTRAWVVLGAFQDEQRVGGAVVARRTPGLDLLEGRDDLAVLFDLRVAPGLRGRGLGRRLFAAARARARAQLSCTNSTRPRWPAPARSARARWRRPCRRRTRR